MVSVACQTDGIGSVAVVLPLESGVEKLNLDTGHVKVKEVDREKTGAFSSVTTETREDNVRVLGMKVASEEVSFKQIQDGLLGTKTVEMDCRTHQVVEESEGLIFTTSRSGSGSVDKSDKSFAKAEFDGKVSFSVAVRDEVKEAAGRGMEVGATEARKINEAQLLCSSEREHQALQKAAKQMAIQGSAGVAGLVAGEVTGKMAGNTSAGVSLGQALAAGSAAAFQEGTAAEKVKHAVGAAGTSLALSAAHEAASGVVGPGSTASIAGRALGALVTSEGSCTDRLANAAQAAGEGALVQTAGMALANSGIALCPVGVINDEGRKGMEFAGGSSLSVGCRDRFGEGHENGTHITESQHEVGVQGRVGPDLSSMKYDEISVLLRHVRRIGHQQFQALS